jgi:hypothetical protein
LKQYYLNRATAEYSTSFSTLGNGRWLFPGGR